MFALSLSSAALSGCATNKPPAGASEEASGPRWTGSFQPTQQRTGALRVTGQNRTFGTITVARQESGAQDRVHVSLTVAVPVSSSSSLRWAMLPERCGSGDLPLIGFEQFPLIDIGTNGRGQIEADLPLVMSPNSSYHVNVYDGGQQLDNVITCANLKFETQPAR